MVTPIPWICTFGLMYISSNGFLELVLLCLYSHMMVFEKEGSSVVFTLLLDRLLIIV